MPAPLPSSCRCHSAGPRSGSGASSCEPGNLVEATSSSRQLCEGLVGDHLFDAARGGVARASTGLKPPSSASNGSVAESPSEPPAPSRERMAPVSRSTGSALWAKCVRPSSSLRLRAVSCGDCRTPCSTSSCPSGDAVEPRQLSSRRCVSDRPDAFEELTHERLVRFSGIPPLDAPTSPRSQFQRRRIRRRPLFPCTRPARRRNRAASTHVGTATCVSGDRGRRLQTPRARQRRAGSAAPRSRPVRKPAGCGGCDPATQCSATDPRSSR